MVKGLKISDNLVYLNKGFIQYTLLREMVGDTGLEPVTSRV